MFQGEARTVKNDRPKVGVSKYNTQAFMRLVYHVPSDKWRERRVGSSFGALYPLLKRPSRAVAALIIVSHPYGYIIISFFFFSGLFRG
jgi:hypothetical protein